MDSGACYGMVSGLLVFVSCFAFFCLLYFLALRFFLLFADASVNLALNKATSQIATFQQNSLPLSASLAVDGNRGTAFLSGQCAHTEKINNAWWMVDLGRMESVSKVYVLSWDQQWLSLYQFELKIGELLNDDRTVVTDSQT